jgi:hypothetical protein
VTDVSKCVSGLFQPTIILYEYYNMFQINSKTKNENRKNIDHNGHNARCGIAASFHSSRNGGLRTPTYSTALLGKMFGGGIKGGYGCGYNSSPYTNQPSTTTHSIQYYQPVYPFQIGGIMRSRCPKNSAEHRYIWDVLYWQFPLQLLQFKEKILSKFIWEQTNSVAELTKRS